jgi:hypothetical protein
VSGSGAAEAGASEAGLDLARSLDESLEAILDVDSLLEATAADRSIDDGRLAQVRELGVHLVGLDEDAGGLGIGLGDRLLLAAVFGRRLVPAALRDEAFGLVPALSALAEGNGGAGLGPLLEAAAAGELRGAAALERVPAPGLADATPVCAAEPGARLLVVLGPQRLRLYDLEAAGVQALRPFAALDAGQGLSCCELGGAEPVAELEGPEVAVSYAGERQQFGRPIASFQAVSHLLAEAKLGIETARAGIGRVVDLAAEAGAGAAALEEWTAIVRTTVPAAARRAIETSIQVHGGIGFSWELGLHLGYRRVLADQSLLGGETEGAETVGAAYMRRRSER